MSYFCITKVKKAIFTQYNTSTNICCLGRKNHYLFWSIQMPEVISESLVEVSEKMVTGLCCYFNNNNNSSSSASNSHLQKIYYSILKKIKQNQHKLQSNSSPYTCHDCAKTQNNLYEEINIINISIFCLLVYTILSEFRNIQELIFVI